MTTQIVAKPSGMVTEPNKVGQFPPGAFSSCRNVAIRSFGVLEQVKKFEAVVGGSFSGPLVGGIYAISEGPLTVFVYEHTAVGTWSVWTFLANEFGGYGQQNAAIPSPFSSYITGDARTGMVLMRNRLIISGTVRSFAIDIYPNPGGFAPMGAPRDCGVYQTCLYNRASTLGVATDPAVLGPNEHISVTTVLRFKFSDGYEIQSPPCVPFDYANLSTTQPQIRSSWSIKSDLPALVIPYEVKHDVYRTRAQSVGYDSINNKYNPVSTGSSFYLSKSQNRSTQYQTNIVDYTLPSTLGEALLTNVSVGGASALPLPPPPTAKTCAAFRGHAFYANRWDPATFTLLNPYFWGFIDLAAVGSFSKIDQGIGIRFVASGLTSTSGNPTVTGFPDTGGVVAGQLFNVYRTDTGVLVSSGNEVLSKTATTVTGTTNITYSGAVRADIIDQIEICGVKAAAQSSPQDFVSQLFLPASNSLNLILDVAAVGLEPSTTVNPAAFYPNFVPTGGMTFRMRTNAPFTIRATNGGLFSPQLPSIGGTVLTIPGRQQLNAFAWSENNEPENVPPSNYAFVGNGEIYKIVPTRDCLWFFCSDGLFRLSGAGGSVGTEYDWVIDPVDPSLVIANPMCAVAYREYVYALTNRGVVSISSEGAVRELSDGRVNPSWLDGGSFFQDGIPNQPWFIPLVSNGIGFWKWMTVDATEDEVWVRSFFANSESADKIWVYNIKTDTWCCRQPTYNGTDMPEFGIYNSTAEVVLAVFNNTNGLVASNRLGSLNVDYEEARVTFQPFYGGSHGAPYTQKHWQDISLSFRSPQETSVATCRLDSQAVSAGTRLIPASTAGSQTAETSRVGFTIPRAWPAVANSIQPSLRITSPSASGPASGLQPIKFEGMQISYVDFTEQRVRR